VNYADNAELRQSRIQRCRIRGLLVDLFDVAIELEARQRQADDEARTLHRIARRNLSAIGGFYAAKTAQYEAKSAASNYQFQSDMDALNARSAEADAQSILESSKSDIMRYTLQAGQEKAHVAATTGARGIVAGVGSARDVAASQEVVKDIDVMTINSNAVRAAQAKRVQATNYKNRALLENTASVNYGRFAKSISPFMAGAGSLLGSASRIGTQWLAGRDN
jgi:hypothetical protein